jgi:hypothetical protein
MQTEEICGRESGVSTSALRCQAPVVYGILDSARRGEQAVEVNHSSDRDRTEETYIFLASRDSQNSTVSLY